MGNTRWAPAMGYTRWTPTKRIPRVWGRGKPGPYIPVYRSIHFVGIRNTDVGAGLAPAPSRRADAMGNTRWAPAMGYTRWTPTKRIPRVWGRGKPGPYIPVYRSIHFVGIRNTDVGAGLAPAPSRRADAMGNTGQEEKSMIKQNCRTGKYSRECPVTSGSPFFEYR